jgi:hypothetical protein
VQAKRELREYVATEAASIKAALEAALQELLARERELLEMQERHAAELAQQLAERRAEQEERKRELDLAQAQHAAELLREREQRQAEVDRAKAEMEEDSHKVVAVAEQVRPSPAVSTNARPRISTMRSLPSNEL